MNSTSIYDIAFSFVKIYFCHMYYDVSCWILRDGHRSCDAIRLVSLYARSQSATTLTLHSYTNTPLYNYTSSLSIILSYITCPSNNYILFYNNFALLMHISAAVWTSKSKLLLLPRSTPLTNTNTHIC